MPLLERLVESFSAMVDRTGDLAPVILLVATFVEYVFPPFPGDLVVVLGAWYAVQGEISWPAAFAAVTGGAVAGAFVDYRIGAALGPRLDRRAARRSAATEARLARFEASYRRWGIWLLLLNRFFPGVRAFLFVAAGASGIPLRTVLLCGAISAALWNALLLAVGTLFAKNVDDLLALTRRTSRIGWAVVGALALVAVAVALWRRRAARTARAVEGER